MTAYYDDTTGLYTAGPVTYILLGFSAVVIVLCLLLALCKTERGSTIYGALPLRRAGRDALYARRRSHGGGGIYAGTVSFFADGKYSSLLFGDPDGALRRFADCACRRRGNRENCRNMTGLGAVVTVFWACFMLVLVFMEHPVEPVELLYAYDLLAMCCALLSIYGATGQIFDRDRARIALFSSLGAVFLLTVSGFGRVMTFFITGSAHFITQVDFRLVVYACACALLRVERRVSAV